MDVLRAPAQSRPRRPRPSLATLSSSGTVMYSGPSLQGWDVRARRATLTRPAPDGALDGGEMSEPDFPASRQSRTCRESPLCESDGEVEISRIRSRVNSRCADRRDLEHFGRDSDVGDNDGARERIAGGSTSGSFGAASVTVIAAVCIRRSARRDRRPARSAGRRRQPEY